MKLIPAIAALCLLSTTALAASPPTLRVCTGSPNLKYYRTAGLLAEQLRGVLNLDIQPSNGSLDNLHKLSSEECDAALVQSDAFYVFSDTTPNASLRLENVGPIYQEYAQLLCNRDSPIWKITDLQNYPETKVAIGPVGSGTATTWYALTNKSKEYNKVNTIPLSGDLALTRIIGGRDAQCLLVVSGLNTDFMKKANDLGAGKLHLVPFDDKAFGKIKDSTNKNLYEYEDIPSGTYPNLQDGFFSSSVSTIAVKAEFVITTSWYEINQEKYGDLSTAVLRMGQQQGGIN